MPAVLEVRERAALPYHRWSVKEYHQMARSGLLDETDRVELIDEGALIDMAPIGSKHAFSVDSVARALQLAAGKAFLIRVQNRILLDGHSEPRPDVAVVKDKNYAEAHPGADDVLLIVEVSDTTRDYDRDVKFLLYARRGIPEVWLDLNASELAVYREPAEGQYRLIRKPTTADAVSPMVVPGVALTLNELLASVRREPDPFLLLL